MAGGLLVGRLFDSAPRFFAALAATGWSGLLSTFGVSAVRMVAAAFEVVPRGWLPSTDSRTSGGMVSFGSGTFGVSVVPRVPAAFETAATGWPRLLLGSGTFWVLVVPLVAGAVAGAATSSAGGGLALIVRLFRQSFQKRPNGSFSSGPGACLGRGGEVRLFEVLEVRLRLPERLRRGIEARLLGRGIESLESKWLRR